MTIVEFYDKTPLENLASSLLCNPDHVIFVGDSGKQMQKAIDLYSEITAARNLTVKFTSLPINRNNLAGIVNLLSEIAETNEECVFDLTGGDDLMLVAVGMVAAKHPHVQLHRINFRRGVLSDCDADGQTLAVSSDVISIDELIRMHGGQVLYAPEAEFGTVVWDFNDEFCADIELMWDICRKDTRLWNSQINTLDKVSVMLGLKNAENPVLQVSKTLARRTMAENGDKFFFNRDLLVKLEKNGLIRNFRDSDEEFSLEFKNPQIARCLTQAGTILELHVTLMAANLYEPNNRPVYDDFCSGVYIDWDGEINEKNPNAEVTNEIDVILMHGLIPVFISCKNGYVETDELYKLSAVADHFGRNYVKKVLVVSDIKRMGDAEAYLRARCNDMDIILIANAADLTDLELSTKLRNIWQASPSSN